MSARRTGVAIIGAGPAGLLLGHLLRAEGVDCIVFERQSAAHVLSRIRAGVLERTTTDLLHRLGIDSRLNAEGIPHDGFSLADGDRLVRIRTEDLIGRSVTVYGQTEVTRDLIDAAVARDLEIMWETPVAAIFGIDSHEPTVALADGRTISCDFVAGCDGFHGPARAALPESVARTFERAYPFGWLGVLAGLAGLLCWVTVLGCRAAWMAALVA